MVVPEGDVVWIVFTSGVGLQVFVIDPAKELASQFESLKHFLEQSGAPTNCWLPANLGGTGRKANRLPVLFIVNDKTDGHPLDLELIHEQLNGLLAPG